MTHRILIAVALLVGLFADGRSDGRRGNEAYEKGDFEAAARAYQEGLGAAAESGDPRLMFGLSNNLGAAQYRLQNPQQALEVFSSAAAGAPDAASRALANYNAGNAAFQSQDLQRALQHYRQALLDNPQDLNAKYNFEFVKRQLQEQSGGGQQQQQNDQEQQQQQNQQNGGGEQNQDQQNQNDEQEQQEGQQDPQNDQGEQQPEQDGESQPQDAEPSEEDPEQQGAPREQRTDLSRDQAERILQALENEEAELLREVQRMDAPPRRVEKDW